jgi:hypothetical protein
MQAVEALEEEEEEEEEEEDIVDMKVEEEEEEERNRMCVSSVTFSISRDTEGNDRFLSFSHILFTADGE